MNICLLLIQGILVFNLLAFITGCAIYKKPVPQTSPRVTTNSGSISESDLGVPIYPNASADPKQSFIFQGSSKSAATLKTSSVSMITPDSVEQVKNFYKEKLGSQARIAEHQSGNGKLVDISFQKESRQIWIQIVPQLGGHGSNIVVLAQFRK